MISKMTKKSIKVLLLTTILLLEENITSAGEAYASTATDDIADEELDSEEELFLFFMFSFFAFCVSLFGSSLLYISYLDDRIMKRYADEGTLVEGEVVSTEFTRGVDAEKSKVGNYSGQKEYFVSVEYTFFLKENFPMRIRKQLRVLECDFCAPDPSRPESKSIPIIEVLVSRDSFFKNFEFEHGKVIQLLVLPNHHLSALPASQVHRRLSTKYRLFSVTFVVVAILISVFCLHMAIPLLMQRIYGEEAPNLNLLLLNLCFVMFALAPIPCIHFFLRNLIQYTLEGEYFEMGGNIINGSNGFEDSSLSTRSDWGWSLTQSTF